MPEVSRFFGIIIRIYTREHGVAHFHASYGAERAVFAIETLACIEGRLPRRAHAMVLEWAHLHRPELLQNWQCAQRHVPLTAIEPLH